MKSKYSILLFFLFSTILLFVYSCKKDTPYKYIPTPEHIEIPSWVKVNEHINEHSDNMLTKEGIALGKKLFFDTRLSGNNTMACATCHNQQAGFTDPRRFSVGIDGSVGTRNAMPLFNLDFADKFFWDGRRSSLEGQAHDPVTNPIEMNANWSDVANKLQNDNEYPIMFYRAFGKGVIDSILITKAIAQYERTLISFNSRFDQYRYLGDSTKLTLQEIRGMNLYFGKANCFLCHDAPLFTNNHLQNNGLDVVLSDNGLGNVTNLRSDNGKFKTPSLRNIAVSGPYMHDGRFATLEEVVNFYNSGVKEHSPNLDNHMNFPFIDNRNFLNNQEKADLVSFLKSLTDEEFIHNPIFRP